MLYKYLYVVIYRYTLCTYDLYTSIYIYYILYISLYRNPNGPGLVNWPAYDARHAVQRIDNPITTEKAILPERRKLWLEDVPAILAGKRASDSGGSKNPINSGWKTTGNGVLLTIILLFMNMLLLKR